MNVGTPTIDSGLYSSRRMPPVTVADQQHFAWLARSFGRTDYLPLSPADLSALTETGEYVEKYDVTLPNTNDYSGCMTCHPTYEPPPEVPEY